MAKQLNVNLAFNADVSKAKTAIQSLQQAMDAINASETAPIKPCNKLDVICHFKVFLKTVPNSVNLAFTLATGDSI